MDKKAKLKALIKVYVREALQEILVEPLLESVRSQEKRARVERRSALDELYEEELRGGRKSVSEGSTRAAGKKATASISRDLQPRRKPQPVKSEAQKRAERLFGGHPELSKLFEDGAPPIILDERDPNLTGGFDGNLVGPSPSKDDFDNLVESMGGTWSRLMKSNKKDLSSLNEAARAGTRRVEEPVFEDEEEYDEEEGNFDEENEDDDSYEEEQNEDDSEFSEDEDELEN
jgi:hypothetical protein